MHLLPSLITEHLKHSMAQHEAYHQKLLVDYQIGLAKLAREKHMEAQKTMSEYPHDPNHPGRTGDCTIGVEHLDTGSNDEAQDGCHGDRNEEVE